MIVEINSQMDSGEAAADLSVNRRRWRVAVMSGRYLSGHSRSSHVSSS